MGGRLVIEEVFETIKTRRSVRAYLPENIPDKVIASVLEAAIWAPTAGNAQPWYFYVLRDEYLKQKLAEAALSQSFIALAPVVIIVCADLERAQSSYGKRGMELYCIQDSAAAVQNMLLCVHALGLGACWVGAFDERAASELLDLPRHHRPVAMVPIGRPGAVTRNPGRRPLHEVYSEID
jgi:nitroreductase